MITFKEVSAHNFRSYKDFKLNLDNQGLSMIIGNDLDRGEGSSNSSGKSSLYFAILYSLYGELPDGTKGDDVINKDVGKDSYTQLKFNKSNHDYTVTRYRKNKKYKNKVILEIDGKDATPPTIKETDSKIIEIMGFDSFTLLNSLVFSPERVGGFVDATDKQRKELLEQLTNTKIYKDCLLLVRDDYKTTYGQQQETQKEIDKYKLLIENSEGVMNTYRQQVKAHDDAITETKTKVQQGNKELKHRHSVVETETKIKELELKEDQQRKVVNAITFQDTKDLNASYNKLSSAYNQLSSKVKDLENKLTEDKDNLSKIENGEITTCIMCGSPLNEEHRNKEIANLTNSIKENQSALNSNNQALDKVTDMGKQVRASLDKIDKANAVVNESLNYQHKILVEYSDQLTKLNNNLVQTQMLIKNLDADKQHLEDLKQQTIAKPQQAESVAEYEDKIKSLQDTLAKQSDLLDKYKQLEKVYGDQGVKSQALGLSIPYLNTKLNEYMTVLTEGTFTAQLTNTSETKSGTKNNKIDIVINSVNSGSSYQDLSSGEKRRVAVALHLAFMSYLKSNIGGINLLVFDEVFDALDTTGIDAVIKLLKQLSKEIGTILVISHNSELKLNDAFDNIITVEKDSNTSYIKDV